MAVDLTLKSVQLTNRDATPPVLNSPGLGGVSPLRTVFGHIASVTAALSITSVIRLVQVPAHAIVKSIKIFNAAQGAGKFDFGVYTPGVVLTVDQDFFATAVDCAAAVLGTEIAFESGTYAGAKLIQPLWQAVGITTEPAKGSMLEIAAVVVTTDVTTGTGFLGIDVQYVM